MPAGEGGDEELTSLLVALLMMGLALAMLLGYGRTFMNDPFTLARAITRWCLRWMVRLAVFCLRHGYRWMIATLDWLLDRLAQYLRRQ